MCAALVLIPCLLLAASCGATSADPQSSQGTLGAALSVEHAPLEDRLSRLWCKYGYQRCNSSTSHPATPTPTQEASSEPNDELLFVPEELAAAFKQMHLVLFALSDEDSLAGFAALPLSEASSSSGETEPVAGVDGMAAQRAMLHLQAEQREGAQEEQQLQQDAGWAHAAAPIHPGQLDSGGVQGMTRFAARSLQAASDAAAAVQQQKGAQGDDLPYWAVVLGGSLAVLSVSIGGCHLLFQCWRWKKDGKVLSQGEEEVDCECMEHGRKEAGEELQDECSQAEGDTAGRQQPGLISAYLPDTGQQRAARSSGSGTAGQHTCPGRLDLSGLAGNISSYIRPAESGPADATVAQASLIPDASSVEEFAAMAQPDSSSQGGEVWEWGAVEGTVEDCTSLEALAMPGGPGTSCHEVVSGMTPGPCLDDDMSSSFENPCYSSSSSSDGSAPPPLSSASSHPPISINNPTFCHHDTSDHPAAPLSAEQAYAMADSTDPGAASGSSSPNIRAVHGEQAVLHSKELEGRARSGTEADSRSFKLGTAVAAAEQEQHNTLWAPAGPQQLVGEASTSSGCEGAPAEGSLAQALQVARSVSPQARQAAGWRAACSELLEAAAACHLGSGLAGCGEDTVWAAEQHSSGEMQVAAGSMGADCCHQESLCGQEQQVDSWGAVGEQPLEGGFCGGGQACTEAGSLTVQLREPWSGVVVWQHTMQVAQHDAAGSPSTPCAEPQQAPEAAGAQAACRQVQECSCSEELFAAAVPDGGAGSGSCTGSATHGVGTAQQTSSVMFAAEEQASSGLRENPSDCRGGASVQTLAFSPSAKTLSGGITSLSPQQFQEEVQLGPLLGVGGAGSVYKATWRGRQVAVKLAHPSQQVQPGSVTAFRREVEMLSLIGRHPHITTVLAACLSPPHCCTVLELAERGSLWELIHEQGLRLEYGALLQLGVEVASAMAFCHQLVPPIVHRDLKTHNILVQADGRARVCDFGLARLRHRTFLTNDQTMLGTVAYMAPENFSSGNVDERADVWSFAVVLWECLTGRTPWAECSNIMQIIMAVGVERRRLPIPADCPPALRKLIKECWRQSAPLRPSFAEVLQRLQQMRAQEQGVGASSAHSQGRSKVKFSPGRVSAQRVESTPGGKQKVGAAWSP